MQGLSRMSSYFQYHMIVCINSVKYCMYIMCVSISESIPVPAPPHRGPASLQGHLDPELILRGSESTPNTQPAFTNHIYYQQLLILVLRGGR